MNFEHEIKQIEKSMAKAFEAGATHALDNLKEQKHFFEKQMMLQLLKEKAHQKAVRIVSEQKPTLTEAKPYFEEWFQEFNKIQAGLKEAFDSKTGDVIGEKVMRSRNKIIRDYGQEYRDIISSVKVGLF